MPTPLKILLFARARDLAGTGIGEVELFPEATVADLKQALIQQYPQLRPLLPTLLVSLDNNYATDATPIGQSREIACFPPVSGG